MVFASHTTFIIMCHIRGFSYVCGGDVERNIHHQDERILLTGLCLILLL